MKLRYSGMLMNSKVPGTRPFGSSLVASWQTVTLLFKAFSQNRLIWLGPVIAVPLLLALVLRLLASAGPRRREHHAGQLEPFIYPLY